MTKGVETGAATLSPCDTWNLAGRVAPLGQQPQDLARHGLLRGQEPANRFDPLAKRQAPFNILNFLPAMRQEQPVQTKKAETLRNHGIYRARSMCPRKVSKPFQMLPYHSGKKEQGHCTQPGMFTQTPRHARPAPRAKCRIQLTTGESGSGCLRGLALQRTPFHSSGQGQ